MTKDPQQSVDTLKQHISPAIIPCTPDYWWPIRHQEKLNELKQMKASPEIVLVGDSITHLWEEPMGTEINAKPIWNEYYGEYRTYNIGYCGDRTEHVIWRIQNGEVDGITPKVAVVLIGTNNSDDRQDPAEEIGLGISVIIDELQQRLPTTNILLLALFPRTDNVDYHRINTQTNTIVQAHYADSNAVSYLDINDHFYQDSEKQSTQGILPDGVHLTEEGYRIWAEAMKPTLLRLINA